MVLIYSKLEKALIGPLSEPISLHELLPTQHGLWNDAIIFFSYLLKKVWGCGRNGGIEKINRHRIMEGNFYLFS
jgi:hypothetical protein